MGGILESPWLSICLSFSLSKFCPSYFDPQWMVDLKWGMWLCGWAIHCKWFWLVSDINILFCWSTLQYFMWPQKKFWEHIMVSPCHYCFCLLYFIYDNWSKAYWNILKHSHIFLLGMAEVLLFLEVFAALSLKIWD